MGNPITIGETVAFLEEHGVALADVLRFDAMVQRAAAVFDVSCSTIRVEVLALAGALRDVGYEASAFDLLAGLLAMRPGGAGPRSLQVLLEFYRNMRLIGMGHAAAVFEGCVAFADA